MTLAIIHHTVNEYLTTAQRRFLAALVDPMMISRPGLRVRSSRGMPRADDVEGQRADLAAARLHSAASHDFVCHRRGQVRRRWGNL